MPLPSQSRSFGSRTSRRRRRKKGPPKAVFIVPVVLVGLVSLYWLFGGSGDETPKASSDGSLVAAADDALVDPVISDPIVRDPVREESPKVETQKPVVEKPTHETLMLGASRTETNEALSNERHQTSPTPTPVHEETVTPQPISRLADDLPQEDPIA